MQRSPLDAGELLALVARHSPDLFSVADRDGRIVHASPSFETVLGHPPASLVGRPGWELVHPDEAAAVRQGLTHQGVAEAGPARLFRMRHADGTWRWVEAAGSRVERGGEVLTVTVGRDVTARREAEERLDLYREIFRNTLDGVAVIDAEGRYVEQNSAHRALVGYADDELRGATPAIHLGEEAFRHVASVLGATGRYRGEHASRARDGTRRTVDLSAFTLRDAHGQPRFHVGIKRDISGRLRAEDELRARLQQLEAIYELSERVGRAETLAQVYDAALASLERTTGTPRSAVLLADADGRMWFKAWRGLSDGYRKAVAGHNPWRGATAAPEPVLVPSAEADPALQAYLPVLRAEGIRALAFIPLVHGGELLGKFMLYRAAPHAWTAEEIRLAQTVARHVASAVQRQRGAQALQDSQRELLDFVENAPVGLHQVAEDGTVLWANRAELAMLGYAREEYVGRPIGRFHADPEVIAGLLDRLRRNEGIENAPVRMRAKDGTIRHMLVSSNVKWERGQFAHSRCFTLDITPLKQAEERREAAEHSLALEQARLRAAVQELRAANARLLELDQLKTQFLNTVAHELRTPLTPMSLQFELLQGALAHAPEQARSLVILQRNLGRLNGLVEDILDVARLQAGRFSIHPAPADFDAAVAEAVEAFQEPARAGQVSLELARGECGPVPCDARRIGQVVFNLLSNALKFTPPGGHIEVRTARVGRTVALRVGDDGAGMTAEQVERLFQPFTQVHDATHGPGGSGLGLYICKGIVEQHDGTIRCESGGPGRGTTFVVTLPLDPPAAG